MALAADFNTLCPLFDFGNGGGVLFPFVVPFTDSTFGRMDLDVAGDTSVIFAKIHFPMDVRLITCEAFGYSDEVNVKAAAATQEPVIAMSYGTAGLTSGGGGTEFAVITCSGSGPIGKRWAGTTTATTISTGQEIAVYLKQAALATTSVNQDGSAAVILWFAVVNAP